MERRLLGIDLGITSAHQAVVLDATGQQVARRKCRPTRADLEALEAVALAGAEPGTVLEVIVEPSAAVWLPVAVFFARRGHVVYRVSVSKAADLRRFLSRHAKSNRIDADALARLPLVDPRGLTPLELPDADQAALDRRVRACDRLTEAIATHKVRIRNLALQVLPTFPTVITNKLGLADLAVLERYADPRALLAAGEAELTALIVQVSRGHHGALRARAWVAAAREALAGVQRRPGGRVRRRRRRDRHRGPPAARRDGRATRPRARAGGGLRGGRP
jgi:transposase